ncbi:Mur ligase [Achaetomium macrosporum]|uniref:dihydrofolate synthase n=1 Tax=Achaetomium macrosporum TaxID=79813 RepID=A0AAN7CJP1_9PEZI|nr:Mur ligase [Achaetomium macrosporum]
MIDLGLARVSRLVQHTPQTWKAIHVAGTNGKGSICAYLSAMLMSSGLSHARFTSPHLIDRWDCIAVNGKPVAEAVFRDAEDVVKQRDKEDRIGATEFELLTATAFEIFHRQKVEYGVVEVGLGGRLDGTNALQQKAVTVIAKIGLDHQSFLGNTIEEIALQKAGIMRPGVPCVVDGSNQPSVLKVIEDHARELGAELHYPQIAGVSGALAGDNLEPHQIQNLACAHTAFRLACPQHSRPLTHFLPAIREMQWPGRLQKLDIQKLTGRQEEVLLDGAHNPQSAEVLARYVEKHLRSGNQPVTWVLAATQGKDMDGIFGLLLKPGDQVAAVRFEPVDGMPWVKPADPDELLRLAARHGAQDAVMHNAGDDVKEALTWASQAAGNGPLVIAGSLYLVSSPNHLIVVCGHAIWLGGPKNGWDEGEWLIEGYKKGETPTFIEHIKAGVRLLSQDERSVLVFSGGPTRKETPLSEARSYYNLAVANAYFGLLPSSDSNLVSTSRILLEERALDSYYNILFSLISFWRHHAVWPDRLTIVSHGFKRNRLVDGHCAAICFPLDRVEFVGINPPGVDGMGSLAEGGGPGEKAEAMRGVQLAMGQWAEDLHGVGEELSGKRRARNCWRVQQRLFWDEEERLRSGVDVRVLEDGGEALVEGGRRPWARR